MKVTYHQIYKCKVRADGKFYSEDEKATKTAFTSKDEATKYCLDEGNKKIGIVYISKPVELDLYKTFEETKEQGESLSL